MIIGRWFWVACIVTTCANAAILRARAQRHIRENPTLTDGYRTMIRGFLLWANIPWIVMGAGIVLGGVPSILHFFRPQDCDPFVLAFFATVFAVWGIGTFWLLFRDGAELLVRHPGILNIDFKSPFMFKALWFLCLGGGFAGVVMMFTMDVPVPP